MNNLSFNEGIQEYSVNGDESRVIRVNTKDFGLIGRIEILKSETKDLMTSYQKKMSELSDSEVFPAISELDKEVRKLINDTFESDICSVAFGSANCMSFCGGRPMFLNFLDALLPEVLKDITEEQKASEQYIKSYTDQAKEFK